VLSKKFFVLVILAGLTACTLSQLQNPQPTAAPATSSSGLTVAWVEQGSLVVWQQGDPRRVSSGGVIRPYIAPDGQHVVFTRGPQGAPETLWVVDSLGTAEQQLVGPGDLRAYRGGEILIGDVGWLDESVIYFNTLRQTQTSLEAQDDLYRANIRTREVALILPGTEGGAFAISPDKAHIAVVYPGRYGRQDARIRLIDPLAFENHSLLFFTGVSTGSEYKFYPQIFWEPDSSALRLAIPDADLVYDDVNAPPTMLWRIDVNGERDSLGAVPASFFGLPQWSTSGQVLTYLQRVGSGSSNDFQLMVADGSGGNPVVYASGQAGTIQPPQWIPGTERFAFAQGNPGEYWLGGPEMSPQRVPASGELVFSPQFADANTIVFASAPGGSFELRYAALDDTTSTLIAAVNNPAPVFDVG